MSPYSTDNYVELINEIFSTVRMIAPDILHEERSNFSYHIAGSTHVGTYNTPDDKLLLIFAVKLQKQSGIERARSMQRNFAKKLIESGNADAALVAFYAEDDPKWRLSFVRLDYEMKIENGKLKATEKLTPAKRYSFLVGDKEPCHTALSHFHSFIVDNNSNPTLDELEEAFSVERVTQEFFDLYCEKYQQLRDWLVSNEDFIAESERCHFTVEQFVKKLLGQIVFLYFLQKKGWLGVGVWPHMLTEKEYKNLFFTTGAQGRIIKEYLPALYEQSGENYIKTSRFRSALDRIPDDAEELIANKMPHSRNWGSGSQTFLRTLFDYAVKNGGHFYEKYLEPLFYDTLNKNRGVMGYTPILHCRIPFLSGGLFEPIDGFDWKSTHFDIPDEIFSNKKSPDDRQADGILDIFDRYNFTMSEDEPLEREVAIDPEMLGKVFENLLEVKDRKSKGAFYTPREIVHYMCRESLINYLVGQTEISESAVRDFILYGDFMKDEDTVKSKRQGQGDMFISEEIFKVDDEGNVVVNRLDDMDQALMSVRVVDLAVGSGAFPLGLLNEIVRARETLTEYMAVAARTKAVSERQAAFMVRELRSQRTPYDLKRYTIKNSIFAADIEPSAVDIAQLRLWLSLVIDDEINPNAQSELDGHVNPMPLPNLECNILCGNSLVDEFEGTQLVLQSDLIGTAKEGESYSWYQQAWETMLPKLIDAQDQLFYCDDTIKKQEIINRINAIRHKMIGLQLETLPEDKREEFYAADKRVSKPFVLWQLEFARVFYEKGGFDIVIGNPPYGLLNKKQNQNTSILATPEEIKYYKEHVIYKPAKGGMINIFRLFICKSHSLLRENGHLSLIFPMAFMCDLSSYELRKFIFNQESVQYIEAFPERDNESKRVFKSAKMSVCILGSNRGNADPNRKFLMRINDDKYVNIANEQIEISPSDIELIDSKALTIPLVNAQELSILLKMCKDAQRMKDFSKCFTGEIDLSLDKKYVKLESTYHRMLRGAQVQKYFITDHISQGDILYLDSEQYSKNVHTPRSQHYKQKRIVMQGITGVNERNRLKMTLIDSGIYCANSVNYLMPTENIEFLLGLCNSHLLNWFFKKLSTNSNVNGYEIDNLPIVLAPNDIIEKCSNLVKELLKTVNENNRQNDKVETELNDIIYNLYGLSLDEKNIVEASMV